MKLIVKRAVEVEATHLLVIIPTDEVEYDDAYEGDGRPPESFKTDKGYEFIVDLTNERIFGWTDGLTVDAHYKPRDGGEYRILDAAGVVIYEWKDCYVPRFLDHNDGGDDYLDFKVGPDGTWIGLHVDANRVSRCFDKDE